LPLCSPELNPIEEAWSQSKQFLKRQKARTLERLFEALHHLDKLITPQDAQGYFQHAEDFSQVTISLPCSGLSQYASLAEHKFCAIS
jgi:hypothetical protein